MAEDSPTRTRKPRRRRQAEDDEAANRSRRGAGKPAPDADEEQDGGVDEEPEATGSEAAERGGTPTVTSEITQAVREAAIEVLKPVARKATTSAAKYAVSKGPDMLKGSVMPKVTEAIGDAGGVKGVAELAKTAGGGLVSKLKPGGGDGGEEAEGTGKGRRLPVQEHVDVGVPIDVAYNQWTQFEEFPKFMHRVEKLEQRDDTHLMWHENIWGVRRQWEAEITSQRPNERISWKSLSGTNQVGVVTFHALSDTLTRVQVNLDFQPHGLKEKTASGFRMSRRALKSDLMRFKAFIEMRDEETGEWRGRIEEGDVVDEEREGEGRDEAEGRDESEAEGRDESEYEEEDEEPEAEHADEPEAEEEEDEPRAGRGKRRDDEDAEEDGGPVAKEPVAAEDESDEEGDEEEEPERKQASRSRRVRRRAPAGTRR